MDDDFNFNDFDNADTPAGEEEELGSTYLVMVKDVEAVGLMTAVAGAPLPCVALCVTLERSEFVVALMAPLARHLIERVEEAIERGTDLAVRHLNDPDL